MSRRRRAWQPQSPYHVISRFIDREHRLLDDRDRRRYLRYAADAMSKWDWDPLSYGLMSTHVHWGAIAGLKPMDPFFRSTHGRFAGHFHRRYGGIGPVFADRPKIHLVPAARLARLVAYQHRNPVDAGVVSLASESHWTSHRAYMRLDPAPRWLNIERALDMLGFEDTAAGRRRFDDFVTGVSFDEREFYLEPSTDRAIAIAQQAQDLPDELWRGLLRVVARRFGTDESGLRGSDARGLDARRLVACVARHELRSTYRDIGAHLGISQSRAHQLVERAPFDGFESVCAEVAAEIAAEVRGQSSLDELDSVPAGRAGERPRNHLDLRSVP